MLTFSTSKFSSYKAELRKKCPYLEFFWSVFSPVSLRIQSNCRKIRTRKTRNKYNFQAVWHKFFYGVIKSKIRISISTTVELNWKRFIKTIKEKLLQKPSREKAPHFTKDINVTSPNYSFMHKNYLKLLFCTQFMSDTGHLFQQNIFSGHIGSHYQMFRLLFLFWSSYCNIFNSSKILVLYICNTK